MAQLHGRLPRVIRAAALAVALVAAATVALDRLFPPDLRKLQDTSALVLDGSGALLRAFMADDGRWRLPVSPAEVDPRYLDMLLAYEDKRFRSHPGVDPLALGRALVQAVSAGAPVSGASTLTMQTVRLLEPRPRTLAAKLVEMMRALQLEARFDKDEILSMYLTLAPFGGNLEGVRAASRFYFGRDPDRLTDAEAALLVALPQSPERLRPDRHSQAAEAARLKVLQRMQSIGLLSPGALAEARQQPVPIARRPAPAQAPHLAVRLRQASPETPLLHTYIDGTLQRELEGIAARRQRVLERQATVAMLVVENRGRKVRAYVGSGGFFDEDRFGQNDMVRAVRSPGSTLKPFIYGLAFDALLVHPETMVVDAPIRFGDYAPENFDKLYRGEISAREALQLSLNIPAVALLDRLGPARLAHAFSEAGVPLQFPDNAAQPGLPIALGGVGTSLEDLVTLYAALADGGTVLPLRLTPPAEEGMPATLLSPVAAWYLTRILEQAPPPPNLLPEQHRKHGAVFAFKTGTSYGFRDAWAIGYNEAYTIGVWVGRPDGSFSPGRLGRDAAAPILFESFDLLPAPAAADLTEAAAAPAGVIQAANRDLPPKLRRFDPQRDKAGDTRARNAPAILFPIDGATLELGTAAGRRRSLPIRASGGTMPLLWLVNGRPIPVTPHRRQTQWQPDGAGLTRITVIDRNGQTASVQVWIE